VDESAPARPNPVRLLRTLRPNEVDVHRRAACRHYRQCLDRAARLTWLSFTCVRCFAFRPVHASRPDRDYELGEILRLLSEGRANRMYASLEAYLDAHRGPDRVQV
jgi:hypothetical protein